MLWNLNTSFSLGIAFCGLVICVVRWFGLISPSSSEFSLELLCQHFIQGFSILAFPLFILLHKVEDVDRIHRKVHQIILLIFETLFYFFIEGVGLRLTSQKDIINELFCHGAIGSLEDEVCSILKHILHLLLC